MSRSGFLFGTPKGDKLFLKTNEQVRLGTRTLHPTMRCRENFGRGDQIEWPPADFQTLLKIISEADISSFPFHKVRDPFLRMHFKRFIKSLQWWADYTCDLPRFMDPKQLMLESVQYGPTFADDLSKLIQYSYRYMTGINYETPDTAYTMPSEIWGFDYFFSPFHLMPWKRPKSQDFDLAFTEPVCVKYYAIDAISSAIEASLRNVDFTKPPFLDDVDRIAMLTSSTYYDQRLNKTVINYIGRTKARCPLDVTDAFVFKECTVYKNPHESRACWIPTMATANTLRLLHKQAEKVFNNPFDRYASRPTYGKLTHFLSEEPFTGFIMVDLKKSGLTFPRVLLRVVRDILTRRYPTWDFHLFKGWEEALIVREDGTESLCTNGVGLGMGDYIISFICSCAFSAWKNKWIQEGYNLDAIFWGDDQVIKITSPTLRDDTIAEILDDWIQFLTNLGFIVHPDKSFAGRQGVLLETYGRSTSFDTKKLGQWIPSFYWALVVSNIAEAKNLVADIEDCIWDDWKPYSGKVIQDVIKEYGYEFFSGECTLPYELGGWVRFYESGLNTAYEHMRGLCHQWSGLSLLPAIRRPGGIRGGYRPNENFINAALGGSPLWHKYAKGALLPSYVRPSARRELETWQIYLKRRQKCFSQRVDPVVQSRQWPGGNYQIPLTLCRKRNLSDYDDIGLPCIDIGTPKTDPFRAYLHLQGDQTVWVPDNLNPADLQHAALSLIFKKSVPAGIDPTMVGLALSKRCDFHTLLADCIEREIIPVYDFDHDPIPRSMIVTAYNGPWVIAQDPAWGLICGLPLNWQDRVDPRQGRPWILECAVNETCDPHPPWWENPHLEATPAPPEQDDDGHQGINQFLAVSALANSIHEFSQTDVTGLDDPFASYAIDEFCLLDDDVGDPFGGIFCPPDPG